MCFGLLIASEDEQFGNDLREVYVDDKEVDQAQNNNYLDYQGSTPCDERVSAAMVDFFKIHGNPHATHFNGMLMHKFYKNSKIKVAKLINAKPRNIYFTSGATESNNLAITGVVTKLPKGTHIITSNIEHKSVLEVFKELEKNGYEVTYLKADSKGIINPMDLEKAIKKNTKFVSIMFVNNEIGTIQNMAAIGSICYKHNVVLHSDCAQGCGKLKVDVRALRIDLLSISGHKMYAPKGIGALYVNVKTLKKKGIVKFNPMLRGGGQQNAIRPGTLPIELVSAIGMASDIARAEMLADEKKSKVIQSDINSILMKYNEDDKKRFIAKNGSDSGFEPTFVLNGPSIGRNRIAGNVNYAIKGVDVKDLLQEIELAGFVISAGSACNADAFYSHVIDAIDPEMSLPPAVIRVSFGRFSHKLTGELFAHALIKIVEDLHKRFPDKGIRACDKSKKKIEVGNADAEKVEVGKAGKAEVGKAEGKADGNVETGKAAGKTSTAAALSDAFVNGGAEALNMLKLEEVSSTQDEAHEAPASLMISPKELDEIKEKKELEGFI